MPYRCCIALGQTISARRCSHQRRWRRSAEGRVRDGWSRDGRARWTRLWRSRSRSRSSTLAHDVLHAQRERAPPKSGHGHLKHET
eukprot:1603631-Prymnesium_polylepis.1